MDKRHYGKLFFGLAASALLGVAPLDKAFANAPRSTPLEIRPIDQLVKIITASEKAASDEKERAKQEVFIMTYMEARPLLEDLNDLKRLPGSTFDFHLEQIDEGFKIRTNVEQELAGNPIIIKATPDGPICEFLEKEDFPAPHADEEEGEEDGPGFVTREITSLAEIIRYVTQRAEETGRIPAGSRDKIDNDDEGICPPSSPSNQNLQKEQDPEDSPDEGDVDLAKKKGREHRVVRVMPSPTTSPHP